MGSALGPVVVLDAATGTGPGPTVDLGRPCSDFSHFAWAASGSGNTNFHFEGSHDGVHWKAISDQVSVSGGGAVIGRTNGVQPYVRYIRGNVETFVSDITVTVVAV